MTRSYTVELRSTAIEDLDDEVLEAFSDRLFRDRTIAGPAPAMDLALQTLELRTSVDVEETRATAPAHALGVATRAFLTAAAAATGKKPDVARASVWLDVEGVEDPDELLSGADVAARLGISRQRVQQLVVGKRFPAAAANFGTVSAWRWGDVAAWARAHDRKVGRPRKKSA